MRLVLKRSDTGSATLSAIPSRSCLSLPPVNSGARVTERLSSNAARELSGAAYKASMIGRPLVAMWTLTCRPESRASIASGELVLSAEVRRFLDAVRKRAARCGADPLVYLWVAENPRNDSPHVHLLTSLDIPRSDFREWAAWSESVWSHGFVHMERLREPDKAGHYLLKAAGYLGKGRYSAQGTVVGSRYGISTSIRVKRESYEVGNCDGDLAVIGYLWGTPARKIGHGYWNGRSICYDDGTDSANLLADLDSFL